MILSDIVEDLNITTDIELYQITETTLLKDYQQRQKLKWIAHLE